MYKFIILYVAAMLILIFLYHYEGKSDTGMKGFRRGQIQRLIKSNAILNKFENSIKEKTKPSTRRKIQMMIEQAGMNMTYEEFVTTSILSSIVIALIFGITLKNVLLGIVFAVIGYFVPNQVISFFKNKRLLLLEKQIGSFMNMSISRYENVRDFNKVLRLVEKEFKGEEPIHTEIVKTIREIDVSVPVSTALKNMADRTGNKYMKRFSSYYNIASEVGTETVRHDLLAQAFTQFEEDYKLKRELKQEIAGPVSEAYIMIGAVPAFAIYQVFTSDGYIAFMTGTTMGRIGTTVILSTLILVTWFVNVKLGAPLD